MVAVSSTVGDESNNNDTVSSGFNKTRSCATMKGYVNFQGVDQSDPYVRGRMIDYLEDLEDLAQIGGSVFEWGDIDQAKPFCWVRDFNNLEYADYAILLDLPFNDRLSLALSNPIIQELYGQDIIRDNTTGDIISSRCALCADVDRTDRDAVVRLEKDVREITEKQPLNQFLAPDEWHFSTSWESSCSPRRNKMGLLLASLTMTIAATTIMTTVPH